MYVQANVKTKSQLETANLLFVKKAFWIFFLKAQRKKEAQTYLEIRSGTFFHYSLVNNKSVNIISDHAIRKAVGLFSYMYTSLVSN